jgi:signal transduction histidine kinase
MDKPKVLVVEDERDVAKVIAINLKLEGMEVVEVHDGPGALKKIEEVHPDCVVLDIMLPKLSGWDILKYIKSKPATVDIPVVMVTAKVGERDQLRGLGAGAVKYITKPFSPIALTEAIKSVLKPQAKDVVARERRDTIERLQLSTLHKISDILISAPELEELLEGVAEKLVGLFDLPYFALVLSEDEPELYVFREAGGQAVGVKAICRNGVSREVDAKLKKVFAINRLPARISEVEGFNLRDVFNGSRMAEDGYMLPLFERGDYLGTIVLAGRSNVTLSLDEQDMLSTIANQVAAAVARAKLHESLREDEVIRRRLLHQTITAQESERRRLASEIHDSVVQALVGISYRLQAVEKKIPADSVNGLQSEIKLLEEQLTGNIDELRQLLLGLRPPMLEEMGLVSALQSHLKNFSNKNDIEVRLDLPEELPKLSRNAEINLFRIIQEALNNVDKHAKASRVTVKIGTSEHALHMVVTDDGKGFNERKARSQANNLGIASMRERAELLSGKLKIISEPGCGTEIKLDVPLRQILGV